MSLTDIGQTIVQSPLLLKLLAFLAVSIFGAFVNELLCAEWTRAWQKKGWLWMTVIIGVFSFLLMLFA